MSTSSTTVGESKPQGQSVIQTLINHPIGFWFIFWGELAERCSFYGMMAILPRFIADENGLYLGDANSNTWVSMFKAAGLHAAARRRVSCRSVFRQVSAHRSLLDSVHPRPFLDEL